jgi:transposase-like protein
MSAFPGKYLNKLDFNPRELLKITVEASLNAEMDAHPGYGKHVPDGYNRKTLKGDHGEIEIATPVIVMALSSRCLSKKIKHA